MRTHTTLSACLLATAFAASGSLVAQDDMQQPARDTPGLHGEFGFGITDMYFFRGIRQESSGLITQPWINLHYDLLDSDDGLQDLKFVFGQWNSLHSGRTGPGGAIWYESRFWLGLEAEFGDRFRGGVRFNTYANPNGAAGTGLTNIEELQFDFAYDDHGVFFEDLALNPYVTMAFELNNQRDSGTGGPGFDKGIYFETGIAPKFDIAELGGHPITLTAPTKFGFSFGDYYENATGSDDFFGYFQTGAIASAPINCLTPRLGPWTAELGLNLIFLGDNLDARNGGDNAELWFSFGLSTQF